MLFGGISMASKPITNKVTTCWLQTFCTLEKYATFVLRPSSRWTSTLHKAKQRGGTPVLSVVRIDWRSLHSQPVDSNIIYHNIM